MKKLIIVMLVFSVFGCSSLNNVNQIAESTLVLKDGRYKNKTWNESLVFTRYSWYKGASMNYDLQVAFLDRNSPFNNWLGQSEREQLKDCEKIYIALVYASINNQSTNSTSTILNNFDVVGLKKFSIPIFSANLKSHYYYQQWNLTNYQIYGFCKDANLSFVEVSLPNYSSIEIMK